MLDEAEAYESARDRQVACGWDAGEAAEACKNLIDMAKEIFKLMERTAEKKTFEKFDIGRVQDPEVPVNLEEAAEKCEEQPRDYKKCGARICRSPRNNGSS